MPGFIDGGAEAIQSIPIADELSTASAAQTNAPLPSQLSRSQTMPSPVSQRAAARPSASVQESLIAVGRLGGDLPRRKHVLQRGDVQRQAANRVGHEFFDLRGESVGSPFRRRRPARPRIVPNCPQAAKAPDASGLS